MTASSWMDNKVVTVMSTTSQPSATGTVLRRQKDGTRVSVPCPEAIITYNQQMGGVDRGDQLRGYYNCKVKSRKFYKYIFYFLLDVSITNAFILYKNFRSSPTFNTIKKFRLQLARELIGEYTSRRRAGPGGGVIRPLPLQHFHSRLRRNHLSQKEETCLLFTAQETHTNIMVLQRMRCILVIQATRTLTAS